VGDEMKRERRKLRTEGLHNLYFHQILLGRASKEDEIGGPCNTHTL